MLANFRPIGLVASFLAVSMGAGCSLFSHPSGAPPETSPPTSMPSSPLRHEALASSTAIHSRHPVDVLYPPPSPLTEQPSEPKPAGDDVIWAPGYWIWDTSEDNWLWVRGVWVHAPPGRRWFPGYWSVAADGWRWVPGYWAVDPPPPPYSPPPALAYSPSGNWLNDPGLAFSTGYGLWWPMYPYPYGHFHHLHHGGEAVSALPPPGSHTAGALHFPLPPLASNVHDAPSTLPHLNMTSILASVPKPLASTFNPPERFELHTAHPLFASHPAAHEHAERISSLFSTAHLEMAHHENLGFHGDFAAHSLASGGEHGSFAHGSEGHGGGGHGR
jgi:hypothetical protein